MPPKGARFSPPPCPFARCSPSQAGPRGSPGNTSARSSGPGAPRGILEFTALPVELAWASLEKVQEKRPGIEGVAARGLPAGPAESGTPWTPAKVSRNVAKGKRSRLTAPGGTVSFTGPGEARGEKVESRPPEQRFGRPSVDFAPYVRFNESSHRLLRPKESRSAHADDHQLVRKGRDASGRRRRRPRCSLPAEARRLHPRLHDDAEEAELGAAQGRARAADERDRGDDLHPGRRPQPAGALDRPDPRRPREGPAGRALPRHPRNARRGRRRRTASRAVPSTAPSARRLKDTDADDAEKFPSARSFRTRSTTPSSSRSSSTP